MKQKDFLVLFGSIAIIVILWIGFTLYNKSVTSSLDPALVADVQPIVDHFDVQTLQKVKDRQNVEPIYSLTTSVSLSGTPTPPEASSAASLPVLPTPTPSGVTGATGQTGVTP